MTCSTPLAPANGSVERGGDLAVYSCAPGYTLVGAATVTCDATTITWSGTSPTCAANLVVDSSTGLEWQVFSPSDSVTQEAAAGYCDALTIDGKSDFRLPSARDLASSMGSSWWNGLESTDWAWASTEQFGGVNAGKFYQLNTGLNPRWADHSTLGRVRCVRGTPIPNPSLSAPGNGTVVDSTTGLIWQQQPDTTYRNAADSATYCAQLSLPGTGWRLPTATEYLSIVDYEKSRSIDAVFTFDFQSEFRTSQQYTTVLLYWANISGRVTPWGDSATALPSLCVRKP